MSLRRRILAFVFARYPDDVVVSVLSLAPDALLEAELKRRRRRARRVAEMGR